MSEIALRTTEFIGKKQKYINYRPVGSVIVSLPTHIIRRKWLEIVCDLVSPKKRDQFKGIVGWQHLCDHWTQALWDEWRSKDVPTEAYPFGELTAVEGTAQVMWDQRVDAQLITLVGKEPLGIKDRTDAWYWSDHERKTTFIISNEDATSDEVKAYGGSADMIKNGKIIITPNARIDYLSDIGLSQGTLDNIANKETLVHPKFDAPVSKVKMNSPDLSGLNING